MRPVFGNRSNRGPILSVVHARLHGGVCLLLRILTTTQVVLTLDVQLGEEWVLGEPISGGGFGRVYAAKSRSGRDGVVKLVPKAPGAQRELLFADLTNVRNVVPIIDQGETDDQWVLAMPRADRSLREHLAASEGPLSIEGTVAVLSDIATALADLDARVVHRDLKPENVLLLDGRWCLADFGISRYAEATTASDTRQHAMSPPYAAPERWRQERASSATDVYSLGIIAYELLAQERPFPGPDFRRQHLEDRPPHLDGVPSSLGALVEECLYKAPQARPTPGNVLARLARVLVGPPSTGLAKLEEANRQNVVRRGEAEREQSVYRSESERREALIDAATQGLSRAAEALREALTRAAPSVSLSTGIEPGWTIQLNRAELRLSPPAQTRQRWAPGVPPFDVVAYAQLSLRIPEDRYGYEGRSHSLWYCDAQEAGGYQWYETAFMLSPFIGGTRSVAPFALDPRREAAMALGPGIMEYQVAWPFTVVSVGDLDEFISRWAGWFADAAQGQLHHPSHMPERQPRGSWRQV